MTGAPRQTIEIVNRIIVLIVSVVIVYCGTQNALLDLGSFRMPSLIPLTVIYGDRADRRRAGPRSFRSSS
jgi:hypothetical protein